MDIVECGGCQKCGQCGWNSLTYLLGFDARQYLAICLPNFNPALLHRLLRQLYINDSAFREWVRINAPTVVMSRPLSTRVITRISKWLGNRHNAIEFNDLWGHLLVMTPYFERTGLNITYVTDQGEQYTYSGLKRPHHIGLFGGNGHWRALKFSSQP